MNTRRIAVTLAGVAAATFMAVGPAAAHGHDNDGADTASGSFSYANRGGPYGITHGHAAVAQSTGHFGDGDNGRYSEEASGAAASYYNRGGPYGITKVSGGFMMVGGYSHDSDH
ncbi:hypothetical protein ABZ721_37690 [Streptomyces sp. NPDC006733]|uniref:hypothetical protein n=1 Tax=Streptomyces sp. NPDC006733 TaxID=3155460 RepID=UPI0034111830